MGNCSPALRSQFQTSTAAQAFYTNVLKCPNGHWLAFFATDVCSNCNNRDVKSRANCASISCINCEYALCDQCFNKKFMNWERKVSKLQNQSARLFLQALRNDIKQFLRQQKNKQSSQYQRLAEFLEQQHASCKILRLDKKPSITTSLQIRVEKVAKLCEKVYERKAYPVLS